MADNKRIVQAVLKMRDARTALKREYEERDLELKTKMEKLENALLKFLQDNNIDSVKTDVGTFYRQEDIKPSCQDWNSFYAWIKENDAFEFLEKRVTKTAVKDFIEKAEDGAPPPGVVVYKEYVVRVRRG